MLLSYLFITLNTWDNVQSEAIFLALLWFFSLLATELEGRAVIVIIPRARQNKSCCEKPSTFRFYQRWLRRRMVVHKSEPHLWPVWHKLLTRLNSVSCHASRLSPFLHMFVFHTRTMEGSHYSCQRRNLFHTFVCLSLRTELLTSWKAVFTSPETETLITLKLIYVSKCLIIDLFC